MTQITKEAIEAASIVTAIEQTITLIERGSINTKLISALLAECKSVLSTLPIAGEGKVKELDEEQIAKLIWQHLPSKVAEEMTRDKHPPLFPQAEYTVATLSAKNFVEAIIDLVSPSSPGKDGGPEVEELREALQRLEDCCDQLAGTRSREVYDAMINSGQADAMTDLDNARLNARKVLSLTASSPVQDTVAVVTGDAALALGLPEGTKLYTRPQPASTALVERLERERDYAVRWANKAVADVKEHDRDRIAELETVLRSVEDVIFGSTLRVGSPEYFGVRKLIRDALSSSQSTSREGER